MLRAFPSSVTPRRRMWVWGWPLCRYRHNGHYAEVRIMPRGRDWAAEPLSFGHAAFGIILIDCGVSRTAARHPWLLNSEEQKTCPIRRLKQSIST
jgi:hypothetical protein